MRIEPEVNQRLQKLRSRIEDLYRDPSVNLPFHGWAHVNFVRTRALEFAQELGADQEIVEAAALVHDLNYLVDVRSKAAAGSEMAFELMKDCGFSKAQRNRVIATVLQAETATRGVETDLEVMALSDGDTLFKILPITPVVFSPKILAESGDTVWDLARSIVRDQLPLLEQGNYFYTPSANARYYQWAIANLRLWEAILAVSDDPVIATLYEESRDSR